MTKIEKAELKINKSVANENPDGNFIYISKLRNRIKPHKEEIVGLLGAMINNVKGYANDIT